MEEMTKILAHSELSKEILQHGQDSILLAIKELERQEKYEQCEYAKQGVKAYCERYKINQKDIRSVENIEITTQMQLLINDNIKTINELYKKQYERDTDKRNTN